MTSTQHTEKPDSKMDNFRDKINGMVVHTCFNNKSYFGYKSNALKSGICKYYRRNESEKFLWCVIEMMLFRFNEKGGGLVTNLLNRLKILLMEDMSCSEIDRCLLGIKKIEEFELSDRKDYSKIFDFCRIVIEGKKGRSISYINCWWRNNPDNLDLSLISIQRVKKYIKKGDNEEILKLGEKLIEYLDNYDERILDILMKMINIEKVGKRYRRVEGLYLFMEIVRDYCVNDKLIKIWDFALEMLNRKSMKERYYYGVWIGSIMWKRNEIDFEKDMSLFDKNMKMSNVLDSLVDREFLELDDYVVKDWHVNKKYSLEKFSKVGAFVEDEDMEILGEEKFNLYKKFYMDKKAEMGDGKKPKAKKVKKEKKEKKAENIKIAFKKVEKKEKTREEIRNEKYKKIKKLRLVADFNDLESKLEKVGDVDVSKIKLCGETTCGNKVMCFEYEGKIWKESRKSMNYNRDYCVVDECKEMFGLKKIGMKRVLADFRIEKKDKKIKSWKNNWEKVMIKDGEQKVVYCVMNKITNCNWDKPMEISVIKHSLVYGCENGGNIGQNKALFKEFVKIGVYRGIFRCSDFNCRNVLVGLVDQFSKEYLVSIDEGDIGKRLDIIGKREKWIVEGLNRDKTIINEIITEIDASWEKNQNDVIKKMEEYKFGSGLIKEIVSNWIRLKEDLGNEGIEFE
jgi:hypothetical protein